MKYKSARPGQWAKKGDRMDIAKKGLWWWSKEEAMNSAKKIACVFLVLVFVARPLRGPSLGGGWWGGQRNTAPGANGAKAPNQI
jgi:hypothetical protein